MKVQQVLANEEGKIGKEGCWQGETQQGGPVPPNKDGHDTEITQQESLPDEE